MKTLKLILSVTVLMTILSCKKPIVIVDPWPDGQVKCKVTLVEHFYSENNKIVTDKYYYIYDSDHRITRIDYGKQQSNEFETFTYSAGKVNWKGVNGDIEQYNLDVNGRITSVTQGNEPLNFKYNMDGQLIEVGIGEDRQSIQYQTGNLTSSDYNGKPWISMSYGNVETNNQVVYGWVFGEVIDFDEIGYRVTPFIGKLSKNLPSTIIYEPGSGQTVYNLTYTYDSGKIKSVTSAFGGNTSEYKFTYECK
ncbi:MAG: DUF4595 domain-containing protein [Pedobacter sp.]